jgi:hypothetical protein
MERSGRPEEGATALLLAHVRAGIRLVRSETLACEQQGQWVSRLRRDRCSARASSSGHPADLSKLRESSKQKSASNSTALLVRTKWTCPKPA